MPSDMSGKSMRSGLSLYANLLDPSAKTDSERVTISGVPVLYRQGASREDLRADSIDKQQVNAASLRFQPTKRPQVQPQKLKSKLAPQKRTQQTTFAKGPAVLGSEPSAPAARPPLAKSTLADWTADGDDNDVNGFYGGEKRQRGGKKKKRKTNKEQNVIVQNWDDIYDPSRPNNYEDYKNSDERVAEIREWKSRIYAHRMARERSSVSRSDSEDEHRPHMSSQFAPPSNLNFAPPSNFEISATPPPPIDSTGEDPYTRRIHLPRMDYGSSSTPQQPPPAANRPYEAPPLEPAALPSTISRAPVRYNLPPPPSELPSSEAELAIALENDLVGGMSLEQGEKDEKDAPRSIRPGQKGFAERLMSKYGWSKGSGLGASGSGIINPLRVQVEKQKKRPDSEGGGFVGPRTGMIVGGSKTTSNDKEEGKFGIMSEVVVLSGMVDGMDLDAELRNEDGGLMQEIGEECGDKYGRVERVFIDRSTPAKAPVFVKFTSQLSALRAVNALEGRIFNGNAIVARFFNAEKFELGDYN